MQPLIVSMPFMQPHAMGQHHICGHVHMTGIAVVAVGVASWVNPRLHCQLAHRFAEAQTSELYDPISRAICSSLCRPAFR